MYYFILLLESFRYWFTFKYYQKKNEITFNLVYMYCLILLVVIIHLRVGYSVDLSVNTADCSNNAIT